MEPQEGKTRGFPISQLAKTLSRGSIATTIIFVLVSIPLYFWAYQTHSPLRFDIGENDRRYLGDESQFYAPRPMSGPIRRPDNSVDVITATGRLTRRRADFRLPYHALRSPLHVRIRSHRFGLGGTVSLDVNDARLGEFLFTERSYPWGGIEDVIPQEVAEAGPLKIKLVTSGGLPPPSHLPEDLGLGIDWIEIEPMSRGSVLLPSLGQWIDLYGLLILGWIVLSLVGVVGWSRAIIAGALLAGICVLTALRPLESARILSYLWFILPLIFFAHRIIVNAHRRKKRFCFRSLRAV
jgi:hypothetical protein